MKVSLNAIREFTKVDLPVEQLVEKIGAQLGAVEEVLDLAKIYAGITIVKVVSCEKHPDADKLQVCEVDDGGANKEVQRLENGHIQIVCGAPNVKAGMLAAWIPPGQAVPSTANKEPFVLEAKELRGVVSNGMLASAHELALSDDHSGLMEIDSPANPGDSFAKVLQLDDVVIDIENKMFTHRPDCFGILGVARELAGIQGQEFHSPEWYTVTGLDVPSGGSNPTLTIKNELPELVPRFMAQVFDNVKVGPSPLWLQSYLARIGMRPINNVVDLTNYVMAVTGQPMHAFDYDKLTSLDEAETATITIRKPKEGETIALLNGKTIKPNAYAVMIASATKLIGVGGVMGGSETEVDDDTTRVILECANFNMYSIRRTSMENGLFTDAVARFNKGQSPLQTEPVLKWAAAKLSELAGAQAGVVVDVRSDSVKPLPSVMASVPFINQRLGITLKPEEIVRLLRNVELGVDMQGEALTVTPPFWRTDLSLPEDIVEEVGRLYGFDHLPLDLPTRSLLPAADNSLQTLRKQARASLSSAGANEALTYSFVHGNLLAKAGQLAEQAFQLANAQSPDLQYFRLSLIPSLLDKINTNIRAGFDEFALFEMGKIHNKRNIDSDKLPVEFDSLALVYANKNSQVGAAFYEARAYLDTLALSLGLSFEYEPLKDKADFAAAEPFAPERSAMVVSAGVPLGIIGEFKSAVKSGFKLPGRSAGFEISLGELINVHKSARPYKVIPRFPKLEQDICLKIPVTVRYKQLREVVNTALLKALPEDTVAELQTLDIFQKAEDKEHKQITFRVSLTALNRTLKSEVMQEVMNKLADSAKSELSAERI